MTPPTRPIKCNVCGKKIYWPYDPKDCNKENCDFKLQIIKEIHRVCDQIEGILDKRPSD